MPANEQQIPSAWTRERRQREQPALSRAQIVAEAVALLDAEGIEALSMRRLGTRLNAAATSLYRHVTNRDELIELVVDEVYGEIEVPEVTERARWRSAMAEYAHSLRSMILRHPWIASMLGEVGLAYLGPNVLRLNDRLLAMSDAAGFPVIEGNRAIATVAGYVVGMGINEAAWLTMLARSGQTEQEWVRNLAPSIERASQDYPRLREQSAVYAEQDMQKGREDSFNFGLDRILDGLQSWLDSSTG